MVQGCSFSLLKLQNLGWERVGGGCGSSTRGWALGCSWSRFYSVNKSEIRGSSQKFPAKFPLSLSVAKDNFYECFPAFPGNSCRKFHHHRVCSHYGLAPGSTPALFPKKTRARSGPCASQPRIVLGIGPGLGWEMFWD